MININLEIIEQFLLSLREIKNDEYYKGHPNKYSKNISGCSVIIEKRHSGKSVHNAFLMKH